MLRTSPPYTTSCERCPERAVSAETYCTTLPAPNAPASAFRHTKRYAATVNSTETEALTIISTPPRPHASFANGPFVLNGVSDEA